MIRTVCYLSGINSQGNGWGVFSRFIEVVTVKEIRNIVILHNCIIGPSQVKTALRTHLAGYCIVPVLAVLAVVIGISARFDPSQPPSL